jgi:actin related protein 2/3 complex subunit 2
MLIYLQRNSPLSFPNQDMLLIEAGNKIIEETLREKFNRQEENSLLFYSEPEKFIILLADFDGVTYRLSSESKTTILLSMRMSCFQELDSYGASQVLAREYGAYYQHGRPEPGYDATLSIDLASLPADKGILR